MSNPKRVDNFAERQKIKDETAEIGQHYICGCGGVHWFLLKNGDCVCSLCLRAQARIIVNELAPVKKLGFPGRKRNRAKDRTRLENLSQPTSSEPSDAPEHPNAES